MNTSSCERLERRLERRFAADAVESDLRRNALDEPVSTLPGPHSTMSVTPEASMAFTILVHCTADDTCCARSARISSGVV